MQAVECPGLPADWLNAWLAAIGLLVLEPRLRLSWTPGPSPVAVLAADGELDPTAIALDAWPTLERLKAMPIARRVAGSRDLERKVPLDVFCERVEIARSHNDSWALSSSATDLFVNAEGRVKNAELDPEAPRGTTLYDRLMKCYNEVQSPQQSISDTLGGNGARIAANGLGFDASRISALADSSDKLVDPVIEVLAFFGLRMFPMRGRGVVEGRSGIRDRFAARQRCWSLSRSQSSSAQRMTWPVWIRPLDLWGVDALLDAWSDLQQSPKELSANGDAVTRLGIHGAWQTRRYIKRGDERSAGLASARIWLDARR